MFAAPAFLAGLLAVALPLWLHRVAQANPTRHPFASLMLMESSEIQRSARRSLRYWTLLTLRIALLIACALAFAGPLLPQRVVPTVAPSGRLHALVVDTSLSMRQADRWQQAHALARSIIESARPNDELMLVQAAGRRIQVVQEAVSADRASQLMSALDELQPGEERMDYGLLMSTLKGVLGATRLPVELHLISDLQRSARPLQFADLEPPAGSRLSFHDVSPQADFNTHIRDASVADDTLTASVSTTFPFMQSLEAVALVDGKEVARRAFQLAPAPQIPQIDGEGVPPASMSALEFLPRSGGEQLVNLPLPALSPTAHRVEVRLYPADQLVQDDRYFLVIEPTRRRVLVISRRHDSDEATYVAAAVDSLASAKLQSETRAAQELDANALPRYAAVIVTDPAALSSDAASRLLEFVRNGGAVFMTLSAGLTEGLLDDWRVRGTQHTPTRIARLDSTHPLLRNPAGWSDVHIQRHVQVTPAQHDRVLIALQSGAPLLIERQVGAGRMLALTSPLAREWNDLATHSVFVRFMAEMASYLTATEDSSNSAQVGSVFATGLSAQHGGQIFDPDGKRVLGLGQSNSIERIVPARSGFFEIRSAGASRWVAVNVDTRESDLTRMSNLALQRWQSLQQAHMQEGGEAAPDAGASDSRVSIGYAVLIACLALLLLETLVANHFLAVRREVPR
jgi:hypothetical protein